MEYVNDIRSTASDIFLTLPLLLVGFIFFMGAMTSNVGLLYLFAGHLLAVPALSFLANDRGPMWFDGGKFSGTKLVKWLLSALGVLYVLIKSLNGSMNNFWTFLLIVIPGVGQFVTHQQGKDEAALHFFNPIGWIVGSPPQASVSGHAAATCAMVPGAESADAANPTNWMAHLTFFFGFLMANASAIMREPAPIVSGKNSEADQDKVDTRVSNRLLIVNSIILISSLVFISLAALRYMKTPCEGSFLYSLFPLTIIGLTGAAWFQLFYAGCGLRPTDILGVVQGMVSPKMADNPIICVGS